MGETKVGWPDRYRPEDLEGMALAPELRKRFERYLAGDALPRSLILHGPPGFGKTTIAAIIAEKLYGQLNVMRVKSAETGNVDFIRTRVIGFMGSMSLDGGTKLVMFEEASGLSPEAQEALRVPMEDKNWIDLCRVIFLTNDVSKLDPAIRSRCDDIELTRPPILECARVLGQVLDAEGVPADPRAIFEFASSYFAGGGEDMRGLLSEAQHHIETQGTLPSGHFEARIFLGRHPVNGKPLFESKTFDRKADASDWATEQEAQRNRGSYQPTSLRITFAEYLRDRWLPVYASQVRNAYNVERVVDKWIFRAQPNVPALGGKALRKLRVADFDKLYEALTEHGMKPRGVSYLHGLLKQALKFAVKKGELANNPAQLATLPRSNAAGEVKGDDDEDSLGPVKSLTPEQERRVLTAAKQDRWSALWHLLLDAALRPGEGFALKWSHIDLDAKLVRVRYTLARVGVNKAEQGWKLTKPKTERSRRDIPISDVTVAELRRWKKQQVTERVAIGPEWQDHGFVFTTEVGTPLGNNMHRAWARLLRAADAGRGDLGTWGPDREKPRSGPTPERPFNPSFRLYVLRHTSLTLALIDGSSLLEVSRRAGHTDLSFTAKMYGHLKAEHTTAAAESFNRRHAASVS